MLKQLLIAAAVAGFVPCMGQDIEIAVGPWNTGDSWGSFHQIAADKFVSVAADDCLTIFYNAGSGAQAQIYAPRKEGRVNPNSASEACHLYTTTGTSGEYIYADLPRGDNQAADVVLTDEMVRCLQLYGLCFEGHGVTFTKITARKAAQPDPVVPAEGLGGMPMGLSPKENLQNLFDSNPSTTYKASQADRAWAGLDLGEKYVISKVCWMSADDESWKVHLGVFEGANNEDFSDALPICIIRSTRGAGQWNEAEVTCSRGFRYVRYVGPRRLTDAGRDNGAGGSQGSHAELAELRFFGEKGEGDDTSLFRFTNLPTVIINTAGMEEPHDRNVDPDKEHDLTATLTVIGTDGSILSKPGIARERGNYSRTFPKRPIRMKFDKKARPLASLKAEKKKWELLNNYGDKSLMRNLVAFEISRLLGLAWTPQCVPVDVIINGEYRGCYQLADSKEVDKNRVNIHEMTLEEAGDTEGEGITGGYFLEVDAYADSEPAGTWFRSSRGYTIPVTVKAPDDKDVLFQTPEPLTYISGYFSEMTSRVADGRFSGEKSYRDMFDVESFLQLLMTNEVGGNKDVMWSFNMYKEQGDPHIYSGPAWDFDVAFDNSRYLSAQAYNSPLGYLYKITESRAGDFVDFTDKVMSDPETAVELRHLWGAARDNGLTYDHLSEVIDHYYSLLQESQALNFERWPILDVCVHDNAVARGSFKAEVDHVRDFCRRIIEHFDNTIGYTPGEHAEMPLPVVEEDNSRLKISTSLGKLWVKDEIIGEVEIPVSAPAVRASSAGGKAVNSGKQWEISKTDLTENHRITVYATHAGRTTPEQVFTLLKDGIVSSVETVEETAGEDLPALYYNMQGVRVDPATTLPGVYICRQGSKVSKVILR